MCLLLLGLRIESLSLINSDVIHQAPGRLWPYPKQGKGLDVADALPRSRDFAMQLM